MRAAYRGRKSIPTESFPIRTAGDLRFTVADSYVWTRRPVAGAPGMHFRARCAQGGRMLLARSIGLALVVLPALAATPATSSRAAQSPFGEVTLTATPSKYEGSCPVRVRFAGKVGVTAHPMVFNYTFERSDGAKSPLKVVRVTNPNANTIGVSEVWQLGTAGQHLHVWMKLRVASGNTRIESNQADAEISCR